jgi:uncharacterized protein (DUF362 family)
MSKTASNEAKVFLGRTGEETAAELERGLAFIDWESIVPTGARVAIKPNLCWPEMLDGVTTRPAMLEAVLAAVSKRTDRIAVVESDGISFPIEEAFEGHGLPAICERFGARLVNLSHQPVDHRRIRVGARDIEMDFSAYLLNEVDVLISLAVLKTHTIATLSFGMKNLWGCIPSSMRILSHHVLAPGIVAQAMVLRPAITIIDGTFGLDRRGPVYGDAIPLNRLIVSNNVVAADATAARLLGFDPSTIEHIRIASEIGLGPIELPAAQTAGEPIRALAQFHLKPTLMDRGANVTYRWRWLTTFVHASPFAKIIYAVTGRRLPSAVANARLPR